MFLNLTLEIYTATITCIIIIFNFNASSETITTTRPDSGPKVSHSASKKLILFSSMYVRFLAKVIHFWARLVLVKGPQYLIYQKSDKKIEQTSGPDEIASNSIIKIIKS